MKKKRKKLNKLSHRVPRELLLRLKAQQLVDLKRRLPRKRPLQVNSQQIREINLQLQAGNLAVNPLQRENRLLLKKLDNLYLLLRRRSFKT